jgi:glycine cleavage system H protein
MSEFPVELRYAQSHEWARAEDEGVIAVGISDHAQDALGDVVYVELPEVGQDVTDGGDMAVVESVKAASDVYSPIDGKVAAVNDVLADDPETINTDPYGDGWIVKITPGGDIDESALLTPDAYQALLDEE